MKKRIAITFFSINNLSAGGGTERQFIRFYNYYKNRASTLFELFIFTDRSSLKQLELIGLDLDNAVIVLTNDTQNQNLILKIWNLLYLYVNLFIKVRTLRISMVHMPLANGPVFPGILGLSYLKRLGWWKGKLSLTITSCYLAYDLIRHKNYIDPDGRNRFLKYFKNVQLDGIISWYEQFVTSSNHFTFKGKPILRAAKYYFASNSNIAPKKKENIVIFAGRLTVEKNPLLFVKCVSSIYKKNKSYLIQNQWRFKIFGGGPLEKEVIELIKAENLTEFISLDKKIKLDDEFNASKIFVSLQDYENFTSLSLLEAMSYGNAVIAMDVGETKRIITHGVNGLLCSKFKSDDIADQILKLMGDSELINTMAAKNAEIASSIHNVQNFSDDIEDYWRTIIPLSTISK